MKIIGVTLLIVEILGAYAFYALFMLELRYKCWPLTLAKSVLARVNLEVVMIMIVILTVLYVPIIAHRLIGRARDYERGGTLVGLFKVIRNIALIEGALVLVAVAISLIE